MSLHPITLQTDKTITDFTKDFETVKQSEKGLVLEGTILNADKEPYDLSASGLYLVYCEQKAEGKMIIDKGNGKDPADDAGVMTITDAKNGKFTYKLCQQAYAATGDAWIEIYEGNNFVDSTESFRMIVEPAANIHYENDNYISDMANILTSLKAEFTRAQSTVDTLTQRLQDQVTNANSSIGKQISDLSNDVKTKTDAIEQEINQYKTEYDGIQSQWDTALKNITDKANTDISAQVTAINTKYTNQLTDLLAKLQNDYDTWKASIVKEVNDILAQVKQNGTDVSNLQSEIQNLQKSLGNIDLTKFVKPSDLANYYTKTEVDSKLADAGKVKTVQKIAPDSSGDIEVPVIKKFDSPQEAYDASKTGNFIAVYDMNDGSQSAVIGDKTVTIQTLYDAINSLQSTVGGINSSVSTLNTTVNGKANQSDLDTLNQTVAANKTTISQLQTAISNLASSDTIKTIQGDITTLQGQVTTLTNNVNNKADSSSLNDYAKKTEVAGLVWHQCSSESEADTYRKNNPNVPLVSW